MEYKRLKNKKDRLVMGFTLIELLVATSVFALILFTATSLFISIFQQQKRTLSQQELLNQTSYAVEYMSRALRMAKKDTTGGCLDIDYIGYNYRSFYEGKGIRFINHSNDDVCQEFFWDGTDQKLKESKWDSSGTPLISEIPLLSDNLQVNYFKIKLSGESGSDDFQPRVTISMEVQVKGAGDQPKKQIQITISQRNLDD